MPVTSSSSMTKEEEGQPLGVLSTNERVEAPVKGSPDK